MLQNVELFGKVFNMYEWTNYFNYLLVLVVLVLLRKRYGYKVGKALWYGVLTLLFGVFALNFTQITENWILEAVSNGQYEPAEPASSFGFILNMAPWYLLYCIIFCVDFRKLTDYVAPAISIVWTFGKVACVFEGCCSGPESPNGLYMPALGYKVIPIQLYESIFYAVIFVISLVLMFTFSKKHEGYILPICGILYCSFKAYAENFRTWHCEWEQNFLNTGRTYWQYYELIQLAVCVIWLIGVIVCEKTGKMPKFETNALKRKVDAFKEQRQEAAKKSKSKKGSNKKKAHK